MTGQKDFEAYLQETPTFAGWDFSYLTKSGRMKDFPLSWSYEHLILKYIETARSMLDMGTGGGEFLALLHQLRGCFPAHTCATEGYEPNIPIARNRLEPLGAQVKAAGEDGILPFQDQEFQLIINRHSFFRSQEIYRILEPHGMFITQQVGSETNREFDELFHVAPAHRPWNLQSGEKELVQAGFEIVHGDQEYSVKRFYDLGAVIYYLQAIPWQVPDFDAVTHRDVLRKIYDRIEETGYLDVTSHRFILAAAKE